VVEDDPLLPAIVEESLSDGGFQVKVVGSGEEALALLKDETTSFDALVTDIHLIGKVEGWEIGRSAREIDPGFRSFT
jgi:DNA-binding response OmpR family regulator